MYYSINWVVDTDTKSYFSNVWIALGILLAIPVTVESREHSFSKLEVIKTYLRSIMGDDWLSLLANLTIKNYIAENLDWTEHWYTLRHNIDKLICGN